MDGETLARIFDPFSAVDGHDGVEQFQQHGAEIKAVVLDHAMPGLNGTEAMRKIRALQPKVPIILISGDGDDRSPSPFTRFLPKP
ncbi:MAG: response regulator, partial [Planctomycetota bacterium]